MRVAVVQVGYGDGEPVAERVERVAALVRGLAGHDLVVLPELWAPEGFSYRLLGRTGPRALDGPTVTAMAAAARDAGVVLHAGSIVERAADGADRGAQGRGLWNTSVVFGPDGALLATYRKVHRFGFGEGEPQLLEAGEDVVTVDVPRPVTGGDDVRLGLATCYDLRFPELFRRLLDAGRAGRRRPGGLAGGPGRALDAARSGPGHRGPGVRGRLQHRRHALRARHGWRQPGRRAGRRGAGRGRRRRAGAVRSSWTSTGWPVCGNASRCSPTGGCDGVLPGRRRWPAWCWSPISWRRSGSMTKYVMFTGAPIVWLLLADRALSSRRCSSAGTPRRRGACSPAA